MCFTEPLWVLSQSLYLKKNATSDRAICNFLQNSIPTLKGQLSVMTFCRVPASLLCQIEQELDTDEKETLLFLCQDLVPDFPVPDVLQLLMALNEREMLTAISLSEFLYRIKRFDLLRKLLGTGRAVVEAGLSKHPQVVSKYRVLMAEISEGLEKEDLRSLSFLLKNYLGASHMEKSFLAIIMDLEKLDLVSPDHLDIIENCLQTINRKDLAKKIQKHQQEALGQFPPMNTSTLQVSFPKISLADPPKLVNQRRMTNGECAVLAEKIHRPIPETKGFLEQESNRYRIQSKPLGVCLIIDCVGNVAGGLIDAFRALHFDVHHYLFLSMEALMHDLCKVARLREHKDSDCFACVLVSRGDSLSVFCTDHVVPGFPLERVMGFFTGDRCPDLLGKPKLFFTQNYIEPQNWQENTSLTEADDSLCTIPQVADILWSHCMLDAFVLERSPNSPSYYLSTLADLLMDPHKKKLPLLDILVELNNKIYERNRTNPAEQYSVLLKHTLRKKLFFLNN